MDLSHQKNISPLARLVDSETQIAESEVAAIMLNDQVVAGDIQRIVRTTIDRILMGINDVEYGDGITCGIDNRRR